MRTGLLVTVFKNAPRLLSNMATTLSHIPEVEQLSPRVIRILGCNPGPFTLQGTNSYLIGTGKRRILLDTSNPDKPEYIDNLKSVLSDHKVELGELVLTHWHGDHIGSVQAVCEEVTKNQITHAKKYPRQSTKDEDLGGGIAYAYIEDGHVFTTEGATLRTIFTPGHSEDHISLLLEEENAVFSGDTVLGEGTCVFEDLYDYMKSVEKILSLQSSLIYPAHGPLVTDPRKHLTMYIDHRNMRESQIKEVLKEHKSQALTAMELVKIIYKDVPEHLHIAAAGNVKLHLGKLAKEDIVDCIGGAEEKCYKLKGNKL